jgi:hypothetical protein
MYMPVSSREELPLVDILTPSQCTPGQRIANEGRVAELLARMQAESKPPKAIALSWVGEEHFLAFFERVYEHKYLRRSSTHPSGVPFTFDFALGCRGLHDGPFHLAGHVWGFGPAPGGMGRWRPLSGPYENQGGLRQDVYPHPALEF